MKRVHKSDDGFYHVKGKKYKELVGSREKVWNETAYKTPGGLTKDELVQNKHQRIVSKKKYLTAKKEKRLECYGYYAKKGKFGFVKRKTKRKCKLGKKGKSRKNKTRKN